MFVLSLLEVLVSDVPDPIESGDASRRDEILGLVTVAVSRGFRSFACGCVIVSTGVDVLSSAA